MPAPLLAAPFEDTLLDNMVDILIDFSDQQSALDANVAFTTERDRMAAPNKAELETGPIVVLYATGSNPTQGGSRDSDLSTITIQCDIYVAELDPEDAEGDKSALKRLYYLKEQVRAALFAKSATDLGFDPGVIGRKRWGRFQMMPQTSTGESWMCAASWTFEIDYEYNAQDLDMVALGEVSINVEKEKKQDPYSTRWAGLYTVQGGD